MSEQTHIIDMSNRAQKQDFLLRLGSIAKGTFRFKIKEMKSLRSLSQNAWYFSCIVPALQRAMAEQGESWTDDSAHEHFKRMFLAVDSKIVNVETGEIKQFKRTKSTTELSTIEFSEYCERCRAFLAEWFSASFFVISPYSLYSPFQL